MVENSVNSKTRSLRRILPRAGAVKYVPAGCIILYILLLFNFASGSRKSFEEVKSPLEAAIDTERLKNAGEQKLKRYYGLNGADYEGVMFYMSQFSISAEEVLLIKVKDEKQIVQVKEAIDRRLESRERDFEGYALKEAKWVREAQLSVRGDFVFLAVGERAAEYRRIFSDSL